MTYTTPSGSIIKEHDIFVENVRIEDVLARKTYMDAEDVFTRERWLKCVDIKGFIPYDGHVGEIFINGKLTHYRLKGWIWDLYLTFGEEKVYFSTLTKDECYRTYPITMNEFKALEGKVQLLWYNR